MKYYARINKKLRYVRVYNVLKPIGEKENALTRFLIKLLVRNRQEVQQK
jgi:hypothetical protein